MTEKNLDLMGVRAATEGAAQALFLIYSDLLDERDSYRKQLDEQLLRNAELEKLLASRQASEKEEFAFSYQEAPVRAK